MTPTVPLGKRKRPVYAESSSEDEAPLASSSPVKAKSAAVPMPGALSATTLPASSVNRNGRVQKPDSDEDDYDDDEPVVKKKSTINGKVKAPSKKKVKKEESGSEDDEPVTKTKTKKRKAPKKQKVKEESDDAAESEDDKPVKKKPAKKTSAKKAKVKEEEDASGSDTPKPKKKSKANKEVEASPKKGKTKTKDETEEEAVYRWWEAQDPNGDGTEKWQTLEHNGVIFPPPYEPLPRHVKMKYNGALS